MHSPYGSPVRPGEKAGGSWGLTVGYGGVNKVVPPTASAVPDVASASKKMQQASRSWNPGTDLARASFSISEKSQQQFAFIGKDPSLLIPCRHGVI